MICKSASNRLLKMHWFSFSLIYAIRVLEIREYIAALYRGLTKRPSHKLFIKDNAGHVDQRRLGEEA